MTAKIIQFPREVREDVTMARIAQKVSLRLGWDIDLQEAISIIQESKGHLRDPFLEAMARKIATQMGIATKPEALQ